MATHGNGNPKAAREIKWLSHHRCKIVPDITPRGPIETRLQDVPCILGGVAEFAARNAGGEGKIADGDLVVDYVVGECVLALCHGTHEHAYTLLVPQRLHIFPYPDKGRLKAQGYLAAVGRQMVSNGILNHTQQLVVRVCGPNGQPMQQLHHETGESLERARNTNGR